MTELLMVWQLVGALFGWTPTATVDFYEGAYRGSGTTAHRHVTFTAPYPEWAGRDDSERRATLSDPRLRMRLVRDYDFMADSDEWPHHAGRNEGWLYPNGTTADGDPWLVIEGGTDEYGGVVGCAAITLTDQRIHLEIDWWHLFDWADRGGTVGEVSERDDWSIEVELGPLPHTPHPDRCVDKTTT